MSNAQSTRRDFLADSGRTLTAAWLSLQLPWLASLAACARDDTGKNNTFVALTPAEARAMRAFAAQILPSDDGTPGAEEAGAVHFVDRALGHPFFAEHLPVIRAGLADLDERARSAGERRGFAALPGAQQIAIMRAIEHGTFFKVARVLVVTGTLADPSYGGNNGYAGWMMVGMDHRPTYSAPFGWYDAQLATDSRKGVA
jgi:gluconate 2-dehydrogenase gamma chain